MQRRARTNQELERVEHRNDDGHDESSLVGTACNLNRHNAYRVSGSHRLNPPGISRHCVLMWFKLILIICVASDVFSERGTVDSSGYL